MKKILVVDSDTSITTILEDLFTDEGYEVVTASDGLEASNLLEKMEERPHVIITDLKNQVMNGVDFIKTLRRSQFYQGPIVVFTGTSDQELISQCIMEKVGAIVFKPCRMELLLTVVKSLIVRLETIITPN